FFFLQAEDGIRDPLVTGVQTCALPIFTVVLFSFPGLFLSMFTRDPGLLAIGVPYLRVLAVTLIATGLEIATAESLLGSGHTREMSGIYTVVSLLRIPLAFAVTRWWNAG